MVMVKHKATYWPLEYVIYFREYLLQNSLLNLKLFYKLVSNEGILENNKRNVIQDLKIH